MDYITPKEASQKWSITERRIQKLYEEIRIDGVVCFGNVRAIPKDAEKPIDGRLKKVKTNSNISSVLFQTSTYTKLYRNFA